MSINRVIVSGNLTRDSELRTTQSGTSVLSMGIAVNDRRRNQNGEWEDVPNFFDCTIFGTRADSLAQYLKKGTKVTIDGKLRWSQWERDGQKRSKVDIIVDQIDFTTPRNSDGSGQSSYTPAPAASSQSDANAYGATSAPVVNTDSSLYDDDIPF